MCAMSAIAPLQPVNDGQKLTECVDVVKDHRGHFDKDQVGALMLEDKYDELPSPFCPRTKWEIGFTMQLNLSEEPEGVWRIVNFPRDRIPSAGLQTLGH